MNKKSKSSNTVVATIQGMHCGSCEVLLERRLRKIAGVTKAVVSQGRGTATLTCTREPTRTELEQAINRDGYRLIKKGDSRREALSKKDYAEIGAVFLILVALYLLLKHFNFLPKVGVSDGMGLGLVFVIGLIAATSTCLAVTGGLLLALAAKYSEQHPHISGRQKFKPTIYFNVGRVAGYTAFGALLGAIGSLFTFSPTASGVLTIIAAAVMIFLGLQMLHLLPFLRRFSMKMPKFLAHRIYDQTNGAYKPWAPFVLGAGTFFLPCGFTQALQFYVLAHGSAVTGATTMFVFALGTLPMLFAVGAVSSFSKGNFHKHFVRVAAVLVILLGVLSLPAGLTLVSLSGGQFAQAVSPAQTESNIQVIDGVQVARMKVNGLEYTPSHFIVEQGVPVRWEIDGEAAAGCGQVITAPTIGTTEFLKSDGITVIEFTPDKTDSIQFSCAMGMTTPGARFDVVPRSPILTKNI